MKKLFLYLLICALLLPVLTHASCSCDADQEGVRRWRAIPLKLVAMFSILVAGTVGVCIPTLGKWIPAIRPERKIFLVINAFAAGVILATGFIHILPDAFENLTSPCLNHSPWQDFPFAGFFAMVAAIGTLILDTVANGYYNRKKNGKVVQELVEADEENSSQLNVHTQATHGHPHGIGSSAPQHGQDLLRRRVISQVLEMGIAVHSVIVGVFLGASDNPSTIKPLIIALSFHQCFEGMALGRCLVQAQFKIRAMITMIIFFSLTLPVGIAIGIGISSVYNENSPTALIVEGILNSGAAGILIYMALVDHLAADLMEPKVQKNAFVQTNVNISLLVGAGFMSLLAKWT